MIIQCPKCDVHFKLDPKVLGGKGRQLRCSRCKTIFFQPPKGPGVLMDAEVVSSTATAPNPSTPQAAPAAKAGPNPGSTLDLPAPPDRRRQDRMFLQAKAELRLKQGIILHGTTRDLSDYGVHFIPERSVRSVKVGDRGDFSFILEGINREYFTEFACEVIEVRPDGLGIRFLEDTTARRRKGSGDTTRPDTLREKDFDLVAPGREVHVRRQGGHLEPGWVVLPHNAHLPPNIQESFEKKSREGTTLVCHKPAAGQDMYKVYFTMDLLAIQMLARDQQQ